MASLPKEQPVRNPENSSVRVEIFDQPYNLRGSDPEYVMKLAEYVDGKMRAVAEATSTVDSLRRVTTGWIAATPSITASRITSSIFSPLRTA